jgi:hypothetical protein
MSVAHILIKLLDDIVGSSLHSVVPLIVAHTVSDILRFPVQAGISDPSKDGGVHKISYFVTIGKLGVEMELPIAFEYLHSSIVGKNPSGSG